MEKPVLFMLTPWVENEGKGPFYCPDCGVVEGFFAYSPDIRDQVDIRSVPFERPRKAVVDCLGHENQSCPVLVLPKGAGVPEGAKQSLSTGNVFIDDPMVICTYLAEVFDGVRPH